MKKVLVCLLIGLAMLTTSCKKNDENSNQNNSKSETPIAIYNNEKGIMTYSFDIDMLNIKINEQFATRTEQPSNRYIVESVQILDSLPSNSNVKPEIKIVILDTENETSNTFWLMEFFTYKITSSSKTEYYLNEDVKRGVYTMATILDGFVYKLHVNGENYLTEKIIDSPFSTSSDYLVMAKNWFVCCTATNCTKDECIKSGTWKNTYCTPCESPGTCTRGPVPWIGGLISGIVAILIAIIGAL
ncbi:MAG: hypothetical protein J6R17_07075 [Bacteroidales bacterium]|nr:hypothetical protein [Bacteroidales bacterium]